MNIKIISDKINKEDLIRMAAELDGEMIKGAVDVKKELMAIGGEFHADCEKMLLDEGLEQKDIWGINLYPKRLPADWLEFISLINIRPRQGNRSMAVENPEIREKIRQIVNNLII